MLHVYHSLKIQSYTCHTEPREYDTNLSNSILKFHKISCFYLSRLTKLPHEKIAPQKTCFFL